MSIIRWKPINNIESFFDEALGWHSHNGNKIGWDLAVDVFEDGGNVVAEMSVPAVDPGKLDISIDNNILTISGSREEKNEKKGKHFYRREIHSGNFERSISLPTEVDSSKASAGYKDGVLRVTMPKKIAKEQSRVKVKVA